MLGIENEISRLLEGRKGKTRLIHFITNYVTMNDVANVTLAFGGKPIMAEAPEEVCEVAALADAVVLNFGTVTKERCRIIRNAALSANKKGIPVVLDPVGVGVSGFRRDFIWELLSECKVDVIKGNGSEIKALSGQSANAAGVDSLEEGCLIDACAYLSQKYNAAAMATGSTDLICHKGRCLKISGGSELLTRITGAGCMTAALIAVCCANHHDPLVCAAAGTGVMKAASAKAHKALKSPNAIGTFRVLLLDNIGEMTAGDALDEGMVEYEFIG